MTRQSGSAPIDQDPASAPNRDSANRSKPSVEDPDEGAGNPADAGEAIDLETVRDRAS